MQLKRTDRLFIDASKDLERIDKSITRLLMNRSAWPRFLADPNGVLVEIGLHPPTASEEVNERVNRVFYAMLANRKLNRLLHKHFESFKLAKPKLDKYRREYLRGLGQSVLVNDLDLDLDGINHLLKDEVLLRQVLRIGLQDLNRKQILRKKHSQKELDAYIDEVIDAVSNKKLSTSSMPVLEKWDPKYGIGTLHGLAVWPEVGPGFTAVAVAEFVALVTQLVEVGHLTIATHDVHQEFLRKASEGDLRSLNALNMIGRMSDFLGQLMTHAHSFEDL